MGRKAAPDWKVTNGDCLHVMLCMESESVDSIVTDPPYGLGFMGKLWDHGVPGKAFWQMSLRVAKPGAHMLAFGGTRTHHRLMCAIEDAGWEIRDTIMWIYGSGFPKSHNLKGKHNGWGTALKPAWEPIILARKPLSGTVAENVLEHGTGALNVDGCRVGDDPITQHGRNTSENRAMSGMNYAEAAGRAWVGRWPANLIHDGSDEVVGLMAEAARFFYCAKASKRDRDEGCEGLEERPNPKLCDTGYESPTRMDGKPCAMSRNHHPTVKPTDLMRYLCRLVTPQSGLVLDPFAGSGSTGKAAVYEGLRFHGIEIDNNYCDIARRRIEHACMQTPLIP